MMRLAILIMEMITVTLMPTDHLIIGLVVGVEAGDVGVKAAQTFEDTSTLDTGMAGQEGDQMVIGARGGALLVQENTIYVYSYRAQFNAHTTRNLIVLCIHQCNLYYSLQY